MIKSRNLPSSDSSSIFEIFGGRPRFRFPLVAVRACLTIWTSVSGTSDSHENSWSDLNGLISYRSSGAGGGDSYSSPSSFDSEPDEYFSNSRLTTSPRFFFVFTFFFFFSLEGSWKSKFQKLDFINQFCIPISWVHGLMVWTFERLTVYNIL